MSPLIVKHKAKNQNCSVTRAGIGIPQSIVEKIAWPIGRTIEVGFIEKARCVLLRVLKEEDEGFRFCYGDARNRTGGRINCKAFIQNYLGTVVPLPKKRLEPIIIKDAHWGLYLFLEPLDWQMEEFSKSGVDKVGTGMVGLYELLGNKDITLRVGQGIVRDRMNAHLKDQRFSPPTVRNFRYMLLDEEEDAKILERVLIAKYEEETGVLPRFQEIRA